MRATRRTIGLGVGLLAASMICVAAAQDKGEKPKEGAEKGMADMAAMMKAAEKYTKPGANHKVLEKFLGKWNTETRFFMGGKAGPPEAGTSEATWLMEGRWLKSSHKGTMMGMPAEGFMLMGYDNFKMSYVSTYVSSGDTAMLRSEGDMDPSGKVLISYGPLDEYLTGEHDKMVKYVWRFESDDKIVFEIHDLPIGEKHTKVIEIVSTRAK